MLPNQRRMRTKTTRAHHQGGKGIDGLFLSCGWRSREVPLIESGSSSAPAARCYPESMEPIMRNTYWLI
ncbi:unnamed protein product, partial [Nesidiocoris tenuis]